MIQDRDEQVAALEGYAAREHARLTLLAIQVAAERFPAELRNALAAAFSIDTWEAQQRGIDARCQEMRETAEKATRWYKRTCATIHDLSRRIEQLEGQLERAVRHQVARN